MIKRMTLTLSSDNIDKIAERVSVGVKPSFYTETDASIIIRAMFEIDGHSELSIREFYDIFHSILGGIRENRDEITVKVVRKYVESARDLRTKVESANRFASIGHVFSNIVFGSEMLREIADMQRLDMGPVKSDGLYPCRRCKAPKEDVTSSVVQRRSADEAPTVINLCNKCGLKWNLNG